jgi:hypothetical protein
VKYHNPSGRLVQAGCSGRDATAAAEVGLQLQRPPPHFQGQIPGLLVNYLVLYSTAVTQSRCTAARDARWRRWRRGRAAGGAGGAGEWLSGAGDAGTRHQLFLQRCCCEAEKGSDSTLTNSNKIWIGE